jgi:hypothetical protein
VLGQGARGVMLDGLCWMHLGLRWLFNGVAVECMEYCCARTSSGTRTVTTHF